MYTYTYGQTTYEGILVYAEMLTNLTALQHFVERLDAHNMYLVAMNEEGIIIDQKDDRIADRIMNLKDDVDILDTTVLKHDTRLITLESNFGQTTLNFEEDEEVGTSFYLLYDLLPEELRNKLKIYIKKRKKMKTEYNTTCGLCHESGGNLFARIFPRKINGNYQYLCSVCWNNQKL